MFHFSHVVPPPILNITVSSVDEGHHAGIPVIFTAKIEFDPSVDAPLSISGVWSKPNRSLDLEADSIVEPYLIQESPSPKIYVSTLTVTGLDAIRGDSGDYIFSLYISSSDFIEGISINSTRSITVLCKVDQMCIFFLHVILAAMFVCSLFTSKSPCDFQQ